VSKILSCFRWFKLTGLLFSAILIGCAKRAVSNDTPAALIACDCPTKDLGTLNGRGNVHATFTITNTSKKRIRMQLARPSCGCLGADVVPREVDPGEIATIRLILRQLAPTQGKLYRESVVLTAHDNDDSEHHPFSVLAVAEGFRNEPHSLIFNQSVTSNCTLTLVTRSAGSKFSIDEISINHASFKVDRDTILVSSPQKHGHGYIRYVSIPVQMLAGDAARSAIVSICYKISGNAQRIEVPLEIHRLSDDQPSTIPLAITNQGRS